MKQLSKRQQKILEFIRKSKDAGNREIAGYLQDVSRITIVRDINKLVAAGLIQREGRGRSVRYFEKETNTLFRYFDVDEYFSRPPDERTPAFPSFNFNIFDGLDESFTGGKLKELTDLNDGYKKRIRALSPIAVKRELERLTIELSWKSSRIEGNTYSLLDTEALIKEHREAPGHPKEEAVMILNHKRALEYITNHKSDFGHITLHKIENIQNLVVAGLNTAEGIRKRPAGIVGTTYRPLDNEYQIREAVEKAAVSINAFKDPFSKALIAILLVSYIQPFEDGNKQTARLLGDAILWAHEACPLSFRSVDEVAYKKAMILFYEQNSARCFRELFVEQFKFSVENYFLA